MPLPFPKKPGEFQSRSSPFTFPGVLILQEFSSYEGGKHRRSVSHFDSEKNGVKITDNFCINKMAKT